MILVDGILLSDPAGLRAVGVFGATARVSIERSATVDGVYAIVTSIAIVNTQVQYPYWDAAGDETSWYRWRVVTDAGDPPTDASPYSDPFAGSSPTTEVVGLSYATMADVLRLFETPPAGVARLNRLAKLLATVADELNRDIGRDFFRHPAVTGTEVRTFNVDRESSRLCIHEGIVSLTKLEVRWSALADYEELDPTDYQLEPLTPELGRPYDHIALLGVVRWSRFPCGPAAVRGTGAYGWGASPRPLVEANAERVRQIAWSDGSYSGAQAGDPGMGQTSGYTYLPDVVYRFMRSENTRFACSM